MDINKKDKKVSSKSFFDRKAGSGVNENEVLTHELPKPVIKRFKRRKLYVRFKDHIWAADLLDLGPLSLKIESKS